MLVDVQSSKKQLYISLSKQICNHLIAKQKKRFIPSITAKHADNKKKSPSIQPKLHTNKRLTKELKRQTDSSVQASLVYALCNWKLDGSNKNRTRYLFLSK